MATQAWLSIPPTLVLLLTWPQGWGVHLGVSTAKDALNDTKSVTLTAHANLCASTLDLFIYGLVIVK